MYLNKGDILSRQAVVGVFKTAKVVSDSADGYYALEVLEPTEDNIFPKGEIIVRSTGVLESFYEKADGFYKVGLTYRYKPDGWQNSTLRYKILDIYTLDNPAYKDANKDNAVAKMTDSGGEEHIVILDHGDFRLMVKA